MSARLYSRFDRIATWPVAALLVVIVLLCNFGFSWRQGALGYGNDVLDARRGYTPADVQTLFENLGEGGRRLYATTEVTLDLVFPLAYGALFAILIARAHGPARAGLLWFPLLTTVTDFCENGSIVVLALTYAGQPSPLAWVAAACTVVKSVLFVVSLLLVLAGGIMGLRTASPPGAQPPSGAANPRR